MGAQGVRECLGAAPKADAQLREGCRTFGSAQPLPSERRSPAGGLSVSCPDQAVGRGAQREHHRDSWGGGAGRTSVGVTYPSDAYVGLSPRSLLLTRDFPKEGTLC